ncbi:hypothetical protein CDV55_102742 [Aspergillus turcosus]|uniref:Uncharacterized protein n=1 Tax=Aspergillus turcosus TaxID=1245748 RepID=A0A397GPC2_9EURO|nr:hypothetical protein CDV55_102742 [Aspergillus turcosus]RLL95962.1 hypothetical protein CFD26_104913 [Aspergillus turcosus]
MVLQNHTIRERPDIIAAIDTTLTGCMVVLSCFENALDKLLPPLPQHPLTSTNTFTSDGTSLPPKTLNIRADELSRLLQLHRFSRVSHRERLDVIQKKEKEIVDKGSVAAAKIPGKYAFLNQQRASVPNVYQSPNPDY